MVKDGPFKLEIQGKIIRLEPHACWEQTSHAFIWIRLSWRASLQSDSNNLSLQTWTLHGDKWWLCYHVGKTLDDFIGPLSSLRPAYKCQPSKMSAAVESAVSGTPHLPFLLSLSLSRMETWRPQPPPLAPPPFPYRGLESNSDKMLNVQQPPFLICGTDLDEKAVSSRSRPLWKGFIRYYSLSFLQGRGQRWLLFAPYFMARKIINPCRVHLVHMEVFFRRGYRSTQSKNSLHTT